MRDLVQKENDKEITAVFNELKLEKIKISTLFPQLNAPNDWENIEFDDFILFSRSIKELAKKMMKNRPIDDDKIIEQIDLKQYKGKKNNLSRVKDSLKEYLKQTFLLNDGDAERIVETTLTRL